MVPTAEVRSSGGLGNTGKVRLGRSPLWWLAGAVVVVVIEADQAARLLIFRMVARLQPVAACYSVQLCRKRQSDVKHCTLVRCPFTTVVRIAKLLVRAVRPARNPSRNPARNPRPPFAAARPPLNWAA